MPLIVLGLALGASSWAREPVLPFETAEVAAPKGKIDELVFAKLKEKGIQPARPCSDPVFVRRVYLDAIGTLPTAQEARDFIDDQDPKKRSALIDRLLARDEYADYWALKWCDLLRVKAEFPINLWPNAVQAYHRWVRTCFAQNMPYDQFARELLTASGSNFRTPQVNFYRAMQARQPEAIARTVALTFMGARAEKWPKEKLAGMAAFFNQVAYKRTAEWKEEIVYFDPFKPTAAGGARPVLAAFPDGKPATITQGVDPRKVFADWLIQANNPSFAPPVANRYWYWLVGRGIVHEVDDFRSDNPPANPDLLAYLAKEFVAAKYDFKQLMRLILNSQTYQLSSIVAAPHPEAEAQFAFYVPRRVDAEVLIDAICQITGSTEEYSSPIPEPFTWIPENQRSIALSDGSISSPFLELFGRPPRDSGLESERNNRSTPAQRLHMLNSSHILRKIRNSSLLREQIRGSDAGSASRKLYMTILSRPPTDQELGQIKEYAYAGDAQGQEALVDIVWALFNSAEFLYRH
ncbi:MAG TPA: DUF1553 domain-containing protein [Verrucomicrobiae bacterium]|nr:DUF1553 domain-containing protein [Verrucomicrobiae bacterium]